ncbi:beta-N-acetylhexosaminidase [Cohnella mopanensis]|uniref:beta-N-acetylhexosaminidase n=1 Tax=Cohnella mopanensis TaxID=2911966 RepID=UPI001EF8C4B9|nr:beta-N-acetylhexosaminidase [Cohnella mopanensis]
MINDLSLTYQIGQRMMAGFDGPRLDEAFINLVKTWKIGNVILFAWNITDKEQLRELCQEIQQLVLEETGQPAFIAIDQEGGAVSRLPGDATRIPGAMAIAATGDPDNAYAAGRITALELRALGVNFNLSPVLDVNSNDANPVIGVRSYGEKPETVIRFALPMMRGLEDGGALSCGKHFPGHGDTSVDSHLALPVVDKTMDELRRIELAPFQAAVEAGIPAIMSSHIVFPQLDPELPATMSRKILTGLLREEMGFQGLIMTDCMEMKAIQHSFGTVKGTVEAAKAGADLLLVSHTASLAAASAQAIREALEAGEIDQAEWERSLERISALKKKYLNRPADNPSIVGCSAHAEENRKLLERTLTPIRMSGGQFPPLGDSPYFIGCAIFRATKVSNLADDPLTFPAYMAEKLGGRAEVTPSNPTEDEIAAIVARTTGASCIVIGTYNGHLNQGQLELVNRLASQGVPVIAVALRNPYDLRHLNPAIWSLAAYEYTAQIFDAVANVLQGKSEAVGKPTVTILSE